MENLEKVCEYIGGFSAVRFVTVQSALSIGDAGREALCVSLLVEGGKARNPPQKPNRKRGEDGPSLFVYFGQFKKIFGNFVKTP